MSRQPDSDFAARFSEIPDPAPKPDAAGSALRLPSLVEAPNRASVRTRRLTAVAGGIAWLAVLVATYGVRRDVQALPPLYVVAQVVVPFLVATGSLLVAVGSGRLGLGLKIGLVSALALLAPLSFWLIALGTPAPRAPGAAANAPAGMLLCFGLTLAWLVVPFIFALFALRGAFAAGAGWRSALVGAAIGLAAGATMNLHCSNVAPLHVFLGHGLPVGIAALLGALVLSSRAAA